jgi:predicted TIM-barrel fold metal-dependent hydrolase
MLTRRNFVTGAIATGALLRTEAALAKASQPSTAVNFEIPPHACDCHTHLYGDQKEFPLSPAHLYTPETFQPEDMSALHRALHMERVVIVTPSVYGPNNNGATLFGMKARGAAARGIAVVNDKTPDSDFDAMYRAGVRGARIISGVSGPIDPAAARPIYQAAMSRFKNHKWMIELYTNLAVISNIRAVPLFM